MSGIEFSQSTGDTVPWDRFLSKSKIPQGHTDELLTWLAKVNQKKNFLKSNRIRDIRKEAILESARKSALYVLHSKQRERRTRWEQMKSSLIDDKDKIKCECTNALVCTSYGYHLYGTGSCKSLSSPTKECTYDEDSQRLDSFLASLSHSKKRKCDDYSPRKRCKA